MRDARRLWLAIPFLLLCLLNDVASGQEGRLFEIGGGVCFSGTNSQPVSNGHVYFVAGEPGCVFGGGQDRKGKWQLNYLVLIKHSGNAASTFDRGSPDPSVSSDSSDGKVRFVNYDEEVRFDEIKVAFSYRAQFDAIKDTLISDEMTFQGKRMDLAKGRVFVVDMTAEPVKVEQVDVKLPSSEEIDFVKTPPERYKAFTSRWLAEVAKGSEAVAKMLKQSSAD
jgi:hypothetical protein